MRLRQGMERNRRVEMVLSMKRHVPHQHAYGPRGQGRTCIGEAVGVFAAARMLCKEDSAQQRLAEQRRDQPVEEWCSTAEPGGTDGDEYGL